MRARLMIVCGVILVMTGAAWSSEPFAFDDGRLMERDSSSWDHGDQGLDPGQSSKVASIDPESGLILKWLTNYRAMPGLFGDDLIGEDSVVPVCEGQDLGTGDAAPRVSWYEGWGDYFSTGRYQAPFDDETCSTISEDLVRYFFTQVYLEEEVDSLMSLGHADSMRVWLNGAQVFEGTGSEWELDMYQVPIHLNQGWNSILVKQYFPELTEDVGYRYFSLRFMEEDGEAPLILTQSVDGWCAKDEGGQNWIYAGGVADLPGALGSVWSSDLRVTNVYPYKMLVTIEYFEEGRARPAKVTAPDASVDIVFQPYESRTWERVLPTLFGLDESQKGMLAVRGFDDYVGKRGTVSLRTYNRSGAGTFGMDIPFFGMWDGGTCCSQTLMGLRNGPGFRTNLAGFPTFVVDTEVTISIVLWDMISGRKATGDFLVRGYFQINDIFDELGMGGIETNDAVAMVSWNSSDTTSRWNFTASANDNITSDPTFIKEGPWFYFPTD